MFFERTGCVPGVWDVDAATWSVTPEIEQRDPDGALLAAIDDGIGWDPEIPPSYVVGDSELAELLSECELALESAVRDVDLSLVGGWVR